MYPPMYFILKRNWFIVPRKFQGKKNILPKQYETIAEKFTYTKQTEQEIQSLFILRLRCICQQNVTISCQRSTNRNQTFPKMGNGWVWVVSSHAIYQFSAFASRCTKSEYPISLHYARTSMDVYHNVAFQLTKGLIVLLHIEEHHLFTNKHYQRS